MWHRNVDAQQLGQSGSDNLSVRGSDASIEGPKNGERADVSYETSTAVFVLIFRKIT